MVEKKIKEICEREMKVERHKESQKEFEEN